LVSSWFDFFFIGSFKMAMTEVVTLLVFFPIALVIVVGAVRILAAKQPEFAHTENIGRRNWRR
jgi:hypothetical protein